MSSLRPTTNSRPFESRYPTSPVDTSDPSRSLSSPLVYPENSIELPTKMRPTSPLGTSRPSASTMRTTVPRMGLPAVPGADRRSAGPATEA